MSDETTSDTTAPAVPPAAELANGAGAPPESAEAAPAPEAPTEPEKPTADAWATLRRAEERLRRQSEEHRAAVKAAEARAAALEARQKEIDELAKRYDRSSYGSLAEYAKAHGIDYDELTVEMLNREGGGSQKPRVDPAVEELRRELAELKAAREEEQRTREERAASERWGAVMSTLEQHIAPPTDGEHAFELLHLEMSTNRDFVDATLREMAKESPTLTVQQAAEAFEAYLLNQTKSRLGLSKVRALLPSEGEPTPSNAPQAKPGDEVRANGREALSHVDSSERATDPSPPKEWSEMTIRERREWEREAELRAARALEEMQRTA